jgi:hypothetical protein
MRLYPHDQDTGGFFVAVLEKDPLPADAAVPSSEQPEPIATPSKDEPSSSTGYVFFPSSFYCM